MRRPPNNAASRAPPHRHGTGSVDDRADRFLYGVRRGAREQCMDSLVAAAAAATIFVSACGTMLFVLWSNVIETAAPRRRGYELPRRTSAFVAPRGRVVWRR